VALDDALTLLAGQTVTINVLANDIGAGLQVTSIEGTAVTAGGDPVAVANGTVQLLAGGSLLFTPAAGFLGPIDFDYTIANADGLESTANVHIDVEINEAPTAVAIANVASVFETNGAAAADIKVGDIAITDDGFGSNTVTLSGADAAKFKVVGSELFLKAGTLLDTEAAASYSVHVDVSDDTLGGSVGIDFTLPIRNVNEAPTGVSLSSASIPENSIVGTVVGTLAAIDPDTRDGAGFELVNNANGAFTLIGDQIVVANPALLNFEAGATRTISVLATDSGGLTAQRDFTINLGNLTGTADNIVSGGNNNANTLNGGTGNDFIAGLGGNDRLNGNAGNDVLDGGAGRDTMSGGAGNDTYIVDNSGDSVSESSGQGTDAVLTTLASYNLANQVENLVYTGNGSFQGRGNDSSNMIVGAAGNDRLDGGAGNDTLLGGAGADTLLGGRGADRLEGGSGNDTLTGGNDSDMFVFHPGFGDDRVTDFAVGGAAHDVLEVASVYSSLSEMIAAGVITQAGADTVITLNADPVHHDQITLEDVTLASLTADHFHFIS
jgi:Ca2+-binding RTX toxin-like protein